MPDYAIPVVREHLQAREAVAALALQCVILTAAPGDAASHGPAITSAPGARPAITREDS